MGRGGRVVSCETHFFTLASSASGRYVARGGIVEQMDLSEKRQVIGRGADNSFGSERERYVRINIAC